VITFDRLSRVVEKRNKHSANTFERFEYEGDSELPSVKIFSLGGTAPPTRKDLRWSSSGNDLKYKIIKTGTGFAVNHNDMRMTYNKDGYITEWVFDDSGAIERYDYEFFPFEEEDLLESKTTLTEDGFSTLYFNREGILTSSLRDNNSNLDVRVYKSEEVDEYGNWTKLGCRMGERFCASLERRIEYY